MLNLRFDEWNTIKLPDTDESIDYDAVAVAIVLCRVSWVDPALLPMLPVHLSARARVKN